MNHPWMLLIRIYAFWTEELDAQNDFRSRTATSTMRKRGVTKGETSVSTRWKMLFGRICMIELAKL